MDHVPRFQACTEASYSQDSIDSLCLRIAQVPTSKEVQIFVLTTTQPIALPLAHADGVMHLNHVVPASPNSTPLPHQG
jgi:hypothetical protein